MKVSVVMTCYNTSKFVAEAIKSVVFQSYKDWELVIVDDASTDNTVQVVNETLAKFKVRDKAKIILHKQNYGCGQSLSDAINASSGELIAVLDSDDVLASGVLALVVQPHVDKSISLVYTNYMKCDSKLQPVKLVKNFQMPEGKSYIDFMKGVSHLKCFKRSSYDKTEGINRSLLKSVDKDLVVKLEEVGKLYYVNTVGYFYREHGNSISNSFFRKPKDKQSEMIKGRRAIVENARIRRSIGRPQ